MNTLKNKKEFSHSAFTKTASAKSINDFKDVFSGILENAKLKVQKSKVLHAAWIETPLGAMLAIADEKYLHLLEFVEWRGIRREIESVRSSTHSVIFPGKTKPLLTIQKELEKYFKGKLKEFKTPLYDFGTPFQNEVWDELKKIAYGTTRSYYDIAILLDKPTAYRAVANANGKNRFVIVIPCHRVINHSGGLGGYGAGLERKQWLIEHEKNNI